MEPEDNGSGAIAENFAWLALGAAVGVTAAMLLAPEKGLYTRRRLSRHVKRGQQSLFDSGQDMILKSRELLEKGREIAQEAAELFERGRRMAEANFDEQLEAEPTFERGL